MTTELGQLRYNSQHNWIFQGAKLVFMGVCFFILYALRESFANPENSLNDSTLNQLGGLALGAVFALIASAIAVHLGLALFKSLTVYEHGVHSRSVGKIVIRRWEDFEEIKLTQVDFELIRHSDFLVFTFFEYKIKDRDGYTMEITNDYRAVDQLRELVVKPIHQHLLQHHRAKLANGDTLHFGKISLSNQFIARGKKQKLWTEIDRYEVAGSSAYPGIAFYFKGQQVLYVPLNGVPNAIVLTSLLDEIEK